MMNKWEAAYHGEGFAIDSSEPSGIVKKGIDFIPARSRILDLGCGNGRNSIYLATLEHQVEAIDLVDFKFTDVLPDDVASKISFTKGSIVDLNLESGLYDSVFAARLFQYLSPDELEKLIADVSDWLKPNGILAFSYTASGGIHDVESYSVLKYAYNLGYIKGLLEQAGLEIVHQEMGSPVTQRVPYKIPAEIYEVISQKTD